MAGSTRHSAQAKTSVGMSSTSQPAMSKSWMVKSRNSPPLVGMNAGGGGAGSWLIRCSVSSAPIAPDASFAFSAWKCGSKRRLKATYSGAAAALSSASASRSRASSRSSGFSQNTALPARRAASTMSRWALVGLAMSTPASSGSARTSANVAVRHPSSAARLAAASGLASTRATRSRRGLAAALRPWIAPIRPAPIRATLGAAEVISRRFACESSDSRVDRRAEPGKARFCWTRPEVSVRLNPFRRRATRGEDAVYQVGQEEIDALTRVIQSRALFRYGVGHECDRFEARYAEYLGVKHFALAASGSHALAAAMTAVGLGPGDEVIIPAHTYMATATSVLTVGAIPLIVDIDESITIDPKAIEAAIGPRTRAIVAVHMWGAACDMDAIMAIAERRNLIVIEDACQGVGGGYKGRKLGSIGHIGAFSFNYYKNMTCGEGGGVAVNDDAWAERARCAIDPCHFYWQGRNDAVKPFSGNGARASELMGAMLNVQLDRIDGMIGAMRAERVAIVAGTRHLSNLGLAATVAHSPEHDCATQAMFTFPSAEAARRFSELTPSVVVGRTGRHTYTEWDQVLMGAGAAHPAMNPFNMAANAECRKTYSKDMCARSLEILERTVMTATDPAHTAKDIADIVHDIDAAARVALGAA